MKTKLKIMGLLAALVSFFGCSENKGFQSMNADEFEKALGDGNAVCLDVRTADEYAEERILSAVNIDVRKDCFDKKAGEILPKDKVVAVYCLGGVRSKVAAARLAKNGFRVVELDKGIKAWKKAGKVTDKEEMDFFTTDNGVTIKIYSIKHASIRMLIADKWLYVDPVTTGTPPETDFTIMPKADYILITHDHFDHLDTVAVQQLSNSETMVIANPEGQKSLGGYVMKNGEKMTLEDGWTLEAVPAYNLSESKLQFHPKSRDNGYVLTIDGFRLYIAGDTEDIPEMADITDIDVAFMPCNLPYTMTPEKLANSAAMVKPKILFPYHYGETDVKAIQKALRKIDTETRIRQYP